MLVVTKAGDGYDYTLSGAPRAPAGSAFVPVLSGKAFPGSTRHRGHGTFHVDFDASFAGLAHVSGATQQDFGSIAVDYDATSALVLDVTFLGSRNSDHPGADAAHPNRTNAVYAFRASDTAPALGGRFSDSGSHAFRTSRSRAVRIGLLPMCFDCPPRRGNSSTGRPLSIS